MTGIDVTIASATIRSINRSLERFHEEDKIHLDDSHAEVIAKIAIYYNVKPVQVFLLMVQLEMFDMEGIGRDAILEFIFNNCAADIFHH